VPLRKLVYSSKANEDLTDLFLWIYEARFDPYLAEQFVQRIRNRCDLIATLPHGGRPRDDLFPGLRTIAFERKAVIAYIVKDETIEIVNVFYGGRDFEAIIGVEEDKN
jgi:toxin ParE1/3/4